MVKKNNNKDSNNNSNYTDKLTSVQRDKLHQMIDKHTATFGNNHTTTHVYTHEIEVTDENKCLRKTYPIPLHYQNLVNEES